MTMEEKCKNCKLVGKIYYPPTLQEEARRVDGCFLFASEPDGVLNDYREVMYLNDLNGHCECFTPKGEIWK